MAFAQQAAPTGGDSPALEQITITGSMIKRTNAETSEAVTVISADSLKNLGITTTEQALQQVTSNQSGTVTASSVASYSGHASLASLRGLGAAKTLVLIDGQRLANNVVFGSGVDLNGIPFASIERIEVLREGASALYGSDAIAGVINFITKKDLKGGEINLTGSHPQQSGGSSSDLDVTWGKGDLATDGYNFMIAGSFTKQNELRAAQRSFASTGYYPAQGLQNLNSPFGPFPGSFLDANGNLFQVSYPTCPGNPQLVAVNGVCQYKYSAVVDLLPPTHDISGLVSFSKSLPANNTFNAQYFYTKTYSTSWGGPQTYGFGMDPTVDATYFPKASNSTCIGCSAAPVLNQPITAFWTDPGNNRYNSDVNLEQRLLLSLTGANFGWDYSGNINYSQNHNNLNIDGGEADESQLVDANGNLSPLINPFGPLSPAGQNLINSAYRNGTVGTGEFTLWGIGGHANHDLWDFFHAGHAATVAVGADARSEKIGYQPTALTPILYPATFYPPTTINGKRNVEALFAELDLPITKSLDVTLSDRLDRYSDFGKKNNGKVAFRWQPFDILTFRGAASTGFRAPSLVDLYSPQTLGATSGYMLGPPCPAGTATGPFTALNCVSQGEALSGGNTHLGPETSDNYDLGFVLSPIENLGITVDYYRINVKNEIQTIPSAAIYANPTTFSSLYVLNTAGTLTPAPAAPLQCGSAVPPPNTCGYILQNSQNTGGIQTSGFDVSVDYLLKTSYGKVRLGSEGTLISNYRLQTYEGGPYLTRVGQWDKGFQPFIRWSQLVTADWTNGDWGAGLSGHYSSPYTDEYTDQGSLQPSQNGATLTVASYTTWNGYGSWKPSKPFTILVGVRNLLNKQPPFSNQTLNWQAGYDPVHGDPILRAYYAKLKYEF